ncbi:MAG: S-adenosylmethionine decarboxylase [Gammaproteobacteria bacterium]|nr:S-adenosylmethionine decarboxylase [Gammaproteobacteria bacterium]
MVEGYDAKPQILMSLENVYNLLDGIPELIGMEPLGTPVVYNVTEKHHPDIGVTGMQIITTSHISIHTFPVGMRDGNARQRDPFFTFDIYSCKPYDANKIIALLGEWSGAKQMETQVINRFS